MRWPWQRQRDGITLCVSLEEDNEFGGPVWYRSVEKAYGEEVERVLKAKPIVVGIGTMESDGVKAKRPGSSRRS